jgi:hypothetical protein
MRVTRSPVCKSKLHSHQHSDPKLISAASLCCEDIYCAAVRLSSMKWFTAVVLKHIASHVLGGTLNTATVAMTFSYLC